MNIDKIDKMINNIYEEYIQKSEFSKQFDVACASGDKLKVINLLVEKYNCDFNDANVLCESFIDGTPLPSDLSPQQQAYNNALAKELLNKPKCPTCGSHNVEKISFTQKAAGGIMFGLFSSDIRNTMHCKNCGYKW